MIGPACELFLPACVNTSADSTSGILRIPHQSGASGSDQIKDDVQGATAGGEPQPVAVIPARGELGTISDEESWDLSGEFAVMMTKLIPLMNRALQVETLKLFLRIFRDLRTGQPYVDPTIYQHCASTADIIESLLQQHRFHPIQPSLLTIIVEKYGCAQSKRLLREYVSKIPKSKPLKESMNELTDKEIESSHGMNVLKLEITRDSDTFCLEDVERAQEALERLFGVSATAMVYAKSETGSVILTFMIPTCTVETFSNVGKSEKLLPELAAEGILSIRIGEVLIDVRPFLISQKPGQPPAAELEAADQMELKPSPSSEDVHSREGALHKVSKRLCN